VHESRTGHSRVDAAAALSLASVLLAGAPTDSRIGAAKLCVAIASSNRAFRGEDARALATNLRHLSVLARLQKAVSEACNCGFLSSLRRSLVPALLGDLNNVHSSYKELQVTVYANKDL